MRKILLSLLASLALLLVPALGEAAATSGKRVSSEQQVLVLLNEIRADHNLTPFTANSQLRNAARAHSADMLRHGYFDHDGLNETWDARVARYLKAPLTGENIAWGNGSYGTPAGIVTQWMNSPTHRAIILTAGLHRVGLGLITGVFDRTPGIVMATADFAA
jgi:uncharacterized protein YkwD